MRNRILEIAAATGLVFAFVTGVLLLTGAPPLDAYGLIVRGAFGSVPKFARVLTVWVPLTLCACGLLYTFRIGLWNIGVEGQIILGAVGTTWVLRAGAGPLPPAVLLGLAMGAGVCLGALWSLGAGLLRTRGGVNEIFAGLGLNFVAQGIVLWLIFGPWKRAGVASMSGTEPFPPDLWLPTFSWGRLSPVALACAVGALVLTAWLLGRTRVGLCLKAVGGNPRAAHLLGLAPERYLLLAMALAGGLAGLAGALQVLGVYHRLIPAISSNYGYLALLVTMLAGFRLSPVVPIALFFAALNVGSVQLPMSLRLDSSLSGVIQGALVLAVLLAHGWGTRRARRGT